MIDQAVPYSSNQVLHLSVTLTQPETSSKGVQKILNSPEIDLPEDLNIDDINARLDAITLSLTNIKYS